MKKIDPYNEKFEGYQFFIIYEILWKTNILKLDEFENMEEYKFISFDILDLNIKELDEIQLAKKIEIIFKYWLGHNLKCKDEDYLTIANLIKSKIKK